MAEPKHTVYHSSVLDADPDTVWAQVRDMMVLLPMVFGDAIENCRWVDGGSVDKFRVVDGADPEFLPFLLGLIEQETDTVKAHFAA